MTYLGEFYMDVNEFFIPAPPARRCRFETAMGKCNTILRQTNRGELCAVHERYELARQERMRPLDARPRGLREQTWKQQETRGPLTLKTCKCGCGDQMSESEVGCGRTYRRGHSPVRRVR